MAINRDKPTTSTTTTKPSTPPVTFNLDDVNKIVSEALAKQAAAMAIAKPQAASVSAKNDLACIRVFKKAGFKDIQPRVNILTFNKWIEKGFRPLEGSKSLKVANLRLFHISQVRQLATEELKALKAAKDQPAAPRSNGKAATVTELHPQ